MKKLTPITLLFALLFAFGCGENQLVNPQPNETSTALVNLAKENANSVKADKVTILHITGTAMLYGVRIDGSRIALGLIDYGHLIEVSENALDAHFAHGDVPAKETFQLHGGEYVREKDLFRGRPGGFVFVTV